MLRYINIKYKKENIGLIYLKDNKPVVVCRDSWGTGKIVGEYVKTIENNKIAHISGRTKKTGEVTVNSTIKKDVEPGDPEYIFALADNLNAAELEYEKERISFFRCEEEDGEFEESIFDFKLRHNRARPIGFNIFLEMVKSLDFDGYIPNLLNMLEHMIDSLEKVENRYDQLEVAKTIFLAELFNNEMDSYLTSFHGSNFIGASEWFHCDAFKQRWAELKERRDSLYARLITIQIKIGKKEINEIMRSYCGLITRYAFPGN